MSGLEIRRALEPDVPTLVALIGGFRDHLRAHAPTDRDLGRHLPTALAAPGVEFWCAWQDARAAGYSQLRFFDSVWAVGIEAHLEDLFVMPLARGNSVGRALLRHALARATERGAQRFMLNTNEGNEAAQALYRSEGLQPQSHALYSGGREILWVKSLRVPRS